MEIIRNGSVMNENNDTIMTSRSCTEQAGDNCWLQLD